MMISIENGAKTESHYYGSITDESNIDGSNIDGSNINGSNNIETKLDAGKSAKRGKNFVDYCHEIIRSFVFLPNKASGPRLLGVFLP